MLIYGVYARFVDLTTYFKSDNNLVPAMSVSDVLLDKNSVQLSEAFAYFSLLVLQPHVFILF